jgi:hypothetical protein
VRALTGLPSGQILSVLKGAAPISRGIAAKELEAVQVVLKNAGIQATTFRGKPPADVLNDLRSRNEVGSALEQFLEVVGYRLVSGYDVGEKYALEMTGYASEDHLCWERRQGEPYG